MPFEVDPLYGKEYIQVLGLKAIQQLNLESIFQVNTVLVLSSVKEVFILRECEEGENIKETILKFVEEHKSLDVQGVKIYR